MQQQVVPLEETALLPHASAVVVIEEQVPSQYGITQPSSPGVQHFPSTTC